MIISTIELCWSGRGGVEWQDVQPKPSSGDCTHIISTLLLELFACFLVHWLKDAGFRSRLSCKPCTRMLPHELSRVQNSSKDNQQGIVLVLSLLAGRAAQHIYAVNPSCIIYKGRQLA